MSIKNKIKKRTKKTKKNNMYGGSATTPPTTQTTVKLSVKRLLESGKYGLVKGADGQLALRHTNGYEIPVEKVNISSALSTAMVKVMIDKNKYSNNKIKELQQHMPRASITNVAKGVAGFFPLTGIAPKVYARSLIDKLVNKGAQDLYSSDRKRAQQTLNSHYRLGKVAGETAHNVVKGAAGLYGTMAAKGAAHLGKLAKGLRAGHQHTPT